MSATRTESRFIDIDFSCGFQSKVSGGMRLSISRVALDSCSTSLINPSLMDIRVSVTFVLHQRTDHTLLVPEYRFREGIPKAVRDDGRCGSEPSNASQRPLAS